MKYKEVALTWNILSTLTYMKIRFFFSWAQLKYLPNQFWFLLSKVEDPIAKAEREFFAIIKKVLSASYLHLWWGKDGCGGETRCWFLCPRNRTREQALLKEALIWKRCSSVFVMRMRMRENDNDDLEEVEFYLWNDDLYTVEMVLDYNPCEIWNWWILRYVMKKWKRYRQR